VRWIKGGKSEVHIYYLHKIKKGESQSTALAKSKVKSRWGCG
jgi:hypothetical protein